MPSEVTLEVTLLRGNTRHRQRGSRSVAGVTGTHRLDTEPGYGDNRTGRRAGGITRYPRGGYERAFKRRDGWEGPAGTGYCCQPDSGQPTVRDERGAYGNVRYGGTRNPLHNRKGADRKLSA